MSCKVMEVPDAISIKAWIPITTPTAITIFQWLYLSDGFDPILLNRSEPLQASIAARAR